MSVKIRAANPRKPKGKRMATRRKTRKPAARRTVRRRRNPVAKPVRRRRRRRNPQFHPAVKAAIGSVAGAAVGAAGSMGLKYTELSPMTRGAILLGGGILAGTALGFVDAAFGAGVGAGLGAHGAFDIVSDLTADDGSSKSMGAVRAQMGAVRAAGPHQLGMGSINVTDNQVDQVLSRIS